MAAATPTEAAPPPPTDEERLSHLRDVIQLLHNDLLARVKKAEADAAEWKSISLSKDTEAAGWHAKYDELVAKVKAVLETPAPPPPPPA